LAGAGLGGIDDVLYIAYAHADGNHRVPNVNANSDGDFKFNRVTWWIWTFMGLILAISYYYSGAVNTIWAPIVEFIGPLIIALLAIKYGEGGIKDKTDLLCLTGGILSIILWIIFKSPVVALVTNLVIDAFALIPTIKKSYFRPKGENFWAWLGTGIGDTINLFAIEKRTFGVVVYPVYMLLADLIIIFILFLRRIKKTVK
jgi:hypothetical protein